MTTVVDRYDIVEVLGGATPSGWRPRSMPWSSDKEACRA